jgi:hypothetical protein
MFLNDGGQWTMRVGRIIAVAAMVGSLTLGAGLLISAGGCSGSGDSVGQASIDPAAQKAAQDKMKEYLAKKPPLLKGPQTKK